MYIDSMTNDTSTTLQDDDTATWLAASNFAKYCRADLKTANAFADYVELYEGPGAPFEIWADLRYTGERSLRSWWEEFKLTR